MENKVLEADQIVNKYGRIFKKFKRVVLRKLNGLQENIDKLFNTIAYT
jgi:hypothetical protein